MGSEKKHLKCWGVIKARKMWASFPTEIQQPGNLVGGNDDCGDDNFSHGYNDDDDDGDDDGNDDDDKKPRHARWQPCQQRQAPPNQSSGVQP